MTLFFALILRCWAQFVGAPAAEPPPDVYAAVISAYSCDAAQSNPMFPCGAFRDGTQPNPALHGTVAACPVEWLGATVTIEGYGAVRCTDTPRVGWYGDSPHIDLFLAYPDAVAWGIQEREVYRD